MEHYYQVMSTDGARVSNIASVEAGMSFEQAVEKASYVFPAGTNDDARKITKTGGSWEITDKIFVTDANNKVDLSSPDEGTVLEKAVTYVEIKNENAKSGYSYRTQNNTYQENLTAFDAAPEYKVYRFDADNLKVGENFMSLTGNEAQMYCSGIYVFDATKVTDEVDTAMKKRTQKF